MKNIFSYIIVLFFLNLAHTGISQQLANTSYFDVTKHYFNPADVGTDNQIRTSLFFRQQWVSFSGAPTTGFLSLQYPFDNLNMSAGLIIDHDQTAAISKTGAQLLYAYKINGLLGEESRLSLGINAGFHQYSFDPQDEVYNDQDDVLLISSFSKAFPSVGFGASFISSTTEYDENVLFMGVSYRNYITSSLESDNADFAREKHLYFNIGTRVYQRDSYLQPWISLNYVDPSLYDIRAGVKYELRDVFWAGLGYSTINELALFGGVIIPEFVNNYGKLKIGVLGNIGITENVSAFGPGFEFYAGYLYDLD